MVVGSFEAWLVGIADVYVELDLSEQGRECVKEPKTRKHEHKDAPRGPKGYQKGTRKGSTST